MALDKIWNCNEENRTILRYIPIQLGGNVTFQTWERKRYYESQYLELENTGKPLPSSWRSQGTVKGAVS